VRVSGSPKLGWGELPERLRHRIEGELGGEVVEAVVQEAGFSPGAPLRVRLASGERAFVKAATREINAQTAEMYRNEAKVGEQLPVLPEVPRLLSWFERPPWVVLIFEDVDGVPPPVPWQHADLVRVLGALADLATRLTPAPARGLPTVGDKHADDFDGWSRLARDPDRLRTADADGWLTGHLEQLDRLAQGWSAAAAGDTVLHADIRADQLLLTDERVYLVDWAHACVGASFVDPLLFFPSVVLDGGPTFDELVTLSPQTRAAETIHLASVASAAASFLIERSTRPPPPGLPTVRAFQRQQGGVLLDWLERQL
jgi:aminoglycoside phosphotransferase (APT) family kinase protein